MDFDTLTLFWHTLRHVKPTQLYHQIYYRWVYKAVVKERIITPRSHQLTPIQSITLSELVFDGSRTFTFLNLPHTFDSIDWNYQGFGKLWTYNLNYFDFLHQPDMIEEAGLALIHDFCSKSATHKDGYEPYPISLRLINWVKFLSKFKIDDAQINNQLDQDAQRLHKQLEYHILANHLFENGFGLLFGAYYLQDDKLYKTAKQIILAELKEQILADGAHYELTPMYHQIMLFRILDAYQLVTKNNWKNQELAAKLKSAASKMLGWINAIAFKNGDLPNVNDTTEGIAPSLEKLTNYATQLEIAPSDLPLKESGYRKWTSDNLELFFDVGDIAPSYQPGHSHADSLQILLYKNSLPILVDTGISTYEKNARRQLERSTVSHNTITVNRSNSSEVWSGFRVGRRARVKILHEGKGILKAQHDGYRNFGLLHQRELQQSEEGFIITDTMLGRSKGFVIEGHLHFHPHVRVEIIAEEIWVNGALALKFHETESLLLEEYQYAEQYNRLKPGMKIVYRFKEKCRFTIFN